MANISRFSKAPVAAKNIRNSPDKKTVQLRLAQELFPPDM
jgi:hypothetical protein